MAATRNTNPAQAPKLNIAAATNDMADGKVLATRYPTWAKDEGYPLKGILMGSLWLPTAEDNRKSADDTHWKAIVFKLTGETAVKLADGTIAEGKVGDLVQHAVSADKGIQKLWDEGAEFGDKEQSREVFIELGPKLPAKNKLHQPFQTYNITVSTGFRDKGPDFLPILPSKDTDFSVKQLESTNKQII